MKLTILTPIFSVCQMKSGSAIPTWALQGSLFSIVKTTDELSVVCEQSYVPHEIKSERDWKILKVEGPLDFGLTGILASIANPLAQTKISIFAISTFDTDYILVKEKDLEHACLALRNHGFKIGNSI